MLTHLDHQSGMQTAHIYIAAVSSAALKIDSVLCAPFRADSIMGVSLFRSYAPLSFGSFDRALSSMFRLTAGETWIDELVPLDPETGAVNFGTSFFINSYIVIVVWILLQVSVAVLLVCVLPME
jgi:hypothetical protein